MTLKKQSQSFKVIDASASQQLVRLHRYQAISDS